MADAVTFAIGGIALVLIGLGVLYRKSAVLHYRIRHDGKSLYRILCTRLKPGDSRSKVVSLLGSGRELSEASRDRLLGAAKKRPECFSEGMLATDTLVNYPQDGSCWMCLQFRDGKLVNFDPAQFTRYEPVCCLAAPAVGSATGIRSDGS